jgi:5'-phosphate synthase pdxT subunit
MKIGILALQGDVVEHVSATKEAAKRLGIKCEVVEVRTRTDLVELTAIVLPGGESTTLQKLCEREGIFEELKKVPNIFGTCAGAILLAKKINNKESDQRTLELMDIEIDRNGYGRQNESFETTLNTKLGTINAIFIRAPRIRSIGDNVSIIAEKNKDGEIFVCEQKTESSYYLAVCFHPELSTTKFHEYFLKKLHQALGKLPDNAPLKT